MRLKEHLVRVEELCWEAMEKGFYNVDDVFAYVNTNLANVRIEWVHDILAKAHN